MRNSQAIRFRSSRAERIDEGVILVDGEARQNVAQPREYEDAGPASMPPHPAAARKVHRPVIAGARRVFGLRPTYSVFNVSGGGKSFEARLPGFSYVGRGRNPSEAINSFVEWFEVQQNVLVLKRLGREDADLQHAIHAAVAWYRDPAPNEPRSVTELLGQVAAHGEDDAAIDLALGTVDRWVEDSAMERVEQVLQFLDPSEFPAEISLGVLTATHRARNALLSRQRFFARCRSALTIRYGEQMTAELLAGLE